MKIFFYYLKGICCILIALCSMALPLHAQMLAASKYYSGSIQEGQRLKSLQQVLTELEAEYQVTISYKSELIANKKVNVQEQKFATLEETLANLLDEYNLRYKKLKDSVYVITEKEEKILEQIHKIQPATGTNTNHNISDWLNITKLNPLKIALPQQEKIISGTVTDLENGESLPGVNVLVKGTTTGTVTDVDGNYRLTVEDDVTTLVFSSVGYTSEEIEIGNRTVINVEMAPDIQALSEVVVVGYGEVKKSDLTGSIASLNQESFNKGVSISADQLIVGRAPGVQVTQSNGEPGGGFSVRIRGSSSITADNEPLYVIDGFPIDNSPLLSSSGGTRVSPNNSPRNPLNSLNPADIESIEILKDASATAIYGSRGANGVILITTKKGSKGGVEVDYNFYAGSQSVANRLDVMNRDQYIKAINEISVAQGSGPQFSDEEINEIVGSGVDTDWQDEIFRNAPVFNHALTLKGRQNKTQYYASLNYFDQKGVIISSGIKKYIVRLNLNQQIGEKLKFGLNLNGSVIEDDYVSYGQGSVTNAGVINSAIDFEPTQPIYDSEGNYSGSRILPDIDHAVAVANSIDNDAVTFRTLANTFAEYEIIKGLSAKLYLGTDLQNQRRDSYVPSTLRRSRGISNAAIATVERRSYIMEATLSYNKELAVGHTINAVGGYTFQKFSNRAFDGEISNFFSDLTKTNNLSLGDRATADVNSNTADNTLLSYLGRINYNFQDRVLLTASYRIDGSSRFGENNKYGFFPSIAVGWRMENENFISQLNVFDQLKLRASWGKTGNQAVANFASLGTLTGGVAVIDDNLVATAQPARIPNPDLKWEATQQTNIGIDFGFVEGRINGSVDYFYKKTEDLLLDLPVPRSTGFGSILSNVGSVENKGFEFMIETHNLTGNFGWVTSLNFTSIKNEVISLGDDINEIITGQVAFTSQFALIRPGEALYSYYGHRVTGIFQDQAQIDNSPVPSGGAKPGNPIFADVNQDGVIDEEDRMVLGSPFPDFTFGMNNSFTYKNFQLDIFIHGQSGSEVLNNNLMLSLYPANTPINRLAEPILNRWTPENPSNTWPSSVNPSSYGVPEGNDLVIQNNSFFRLRNVQLNYQVPTANISWLRSANVYVSGQNLITLTDYIGYDPEVSSFGSSGIVVDYNAYPTARTFMLGVNLGF